MIVIGITGPTGSGKTTALDALKAIGAEVIDCDALYYKLLRSDEDLRKALIDAFGQIFLPSGELDRRKLGTLVFGNQKEMKRLNSIVFPAVSGAVERILQNSNAPIGVIDAINLIESGMGELCDWTIGITAPRDVRIRRIMARDKITEEYAASRVDAQKPDSFYKKRCSFLLENRAGSKEEFRKLIGEFFEDLLEMQ